MAKKNKKYTKNVSGKYYVDQSCIACDSCTAIASDFFKMNDEEGYAYVQAQPVLKEEINQCEDALEACPVFAIGNDG